MTHKSKGIVLRTIKYGETSIIATIFTELFGIQTYMVNGVRTSKKTSAKAAYFQPGCILEMVVYHNDLHAMHRIKEFKWAYIYEHILSNVVKNSIALFMVEVINKSLKQPEENTKLFYFCEDALLQLDIANSNVAANFPLYFTLHLTHFFGFRMNDNYDEKNNILDLEEGVFVHEQPAHANFIDGEQALITSQLLKVMQPFELAEFKLNSHTRKNLLYKYQDYYALHIPNFGILKTLPILHEVLA